MYEHFVNNGIPVHGMASLIQDGPNVNTTIFRKMNELIFQDCLEFHIASMLFIMHLEKVLRNMEKKLTNFVWIYIHSSSIVQLDMRILRTSSLKWNLNWQLATAY